MRFCLVSERSVPEETVRFLREACQARGNAFDLVIGRTCEFDPALKLAPAICIKQPFPWLPH